MFQLTAALSQAITTAGGTVLTRVGAQQLIAPDAASHGVRHPDSVEQPDSRQQH